jgi:hypothetical protein
LVPVVGTLCIGRKAQDFIDLVVCLECTVVVNVKAMAIVGTGLDANVKMRDVGCGISLLCNCHLLAKGQKIRVWGRKVHELKSSHHCQEEPGP